MTYFQLRVISIAIFVLCCFTFSVAQNQGTSIFSDVPEAQRAGFIERFNLLIEYQKTQQWDKQYGLLASRITSAEGKLDFINRTKQAYTKWGRLPLLGFTPYRVKLVEPDAKTKFWAVVGCSELSDKGQKIYKYAASEAYREKNDWFFSELQNYGDGDEKDPCSTKSRLPQRIGTVNDFADVIDSETETKIGKMLSDLLAVNKVEFLVVTIKTTGEDASSVYIPSLIRLWGIGVDKPDRATAVLFVIINDTTWSIQSNRPFQTVLPGEEVSRLANKMSVPFSEDRYGDGIAIFIESFVKRLSEPNTKNVASTK